MNNKLNIYAFALVLLSSPAFANESLDAAKKTISETTEAVKQEANVQPAKAMTWLEQFQAWLTEIQGQSKTTLKDIKSKKEELKAAAKKTEEFIEEEKEFLEEASKEISAELDDILD
ncbi:MAG: hypothetical protein HRT47_07830 [Candidatus Caenarcaniphilales bacterium]|nr:hypothetical protein [Candidatus Caenarcaniphilales bacterium]